MKQFNKAIVRSNWSINCKLGQCKHCWSWSI